MDQKIIEKIQKLLMLGTSPVEAEAKAAMTKAGQLMAKHGVTHSQIENMREDDSGIGDERITQNAAASKWEKPLFAGLAGIFGCRPIRIPGRKRGSGQFVFFGVQEDVDMCVWYHKHLRRVIRRQAEMNYKLENDRKDYSLGMVMTIIRRLSEAYTPAKTEATGTDLIVLKDQLITEKLKEKFNRLKASAPFTSKVKNSGAMTHGRVDGETANIHMNINA